MMHRLAEIRECGKSLKFDYQATRGLALATFVDPKTGDRVFVAKEAAGDQSAPQAV